MSATKSYVMVMEVGKDPTEEIELARFLIGKMSLMSHAGDYNEYVFYTADLTDEEFVYGALKFAPTVKFLEYKEESMRDIYTRVFDSGYDPKRPSQISISDSDS